MSQGALSGDNEDDHGANNMGDRTLADKTRKARGDHHVGHGGSPMSQKSKISHLSRPKRRADQTFDDALIKKTKDLDADHGDMS